MLWAVLEAFERAGLRYAILHGYEHYPERIRSDVDCVVDPKVPLRTVRRIVHEAAAKCGAKLVRARGYHVTLAGHDDGDAPVFLILDLCRDAEMGGLTFYAGAEILNSRRKHRGFWIPAPDVAFGAYVARCIARGTLDQHRIDTLGGLYSQDPEGCERQLQRLWSSKDRLLLQAMATGFPAEVIQQASRLRASLAWASALRFPGAFLAHPVDRLAERLDRLLQPDGLSIVLLGPDGAGKSSTIDAVGGQALLPLFDSSVCWGFAPPLHRLIGRNLGPSSAPHALRPRSPVTSVVKACYWLGYSLLNQVRVRITAARGTLVLYDRHFVDLLVDPKRYRYSGPGWLTKLIWRLIPKPDLVILLNAPAEVIQARKQEVPLATTRQQAEAYLQLVQSLDYGRVIDAAQPFGQVVSQVNHLILEAASARTLRRLKLGSARGAAAQRTGWT